MGKNMLKCPIQSPELRHKCDATQMKVRGNKTYSTQQMTQRVCGGGACIIV